MRHPPTLHSGDIDWKSVRLLLFSADDAFRFLVRQTFRKLNVRDVLSTSVAADAQTFMGQSPDIALIDLETDPTAGFACLERVRGADAEIPVLVVARSDDKALMHPALKAGIEGAVPKRVSGHELAHRVSQTLKTPKRLPAPAEIKPRPPIVLEKVPPTPVKVEAAAPTAATAAAGPADGDALKRELAALTAKLGQSPVVSGKAPGGTMTGGHGGTIGSGSMGGGSSAPVRPGGGTYGGADLPAAKGAGGGGLLVDDRPAASVKSGGKLDFDDFAVVAPKVSGGKLIEDDGPAPAKRDQAIELRQDARDQAAKKRAEDAKAKWKELLEEAGHETRTGKDVAALNVDAIVAEHGLWLTSKGGEGKRATFQGMDLAGADLSGAILANATFREVDLSDAHLVESRLDGADFRYAVMGAANLARAELGVAQLRHADLRLANLEGANLRGADLSGARLAGSKLEGADFGGVTLISADLCEADLSKVENLKQSQVEKALCDMKTKLPPGIFRPRKDED
ncbi:MAG: pentapeptide repeat-containing protein [Alphaproteobacteria bacterium]|nr:pentapeptide repeat-containing protein [Alphaproteobacteria bacterium]